MVQQKLRFAQQQLAISWGLSEISWGILVQRFGHGFDTTDARSKQQEAGLKWESWSKK